MPVTFEIANAAFSDQAKRILRATGRDAGEVLKAEGRLFLRDVVALTPPTGKSPFRESLNVQRRAGNAAVASDIRKCFRDWHSLAMVKNKPKLATDLAKYAANGSLTKATTLLRGIGVQMPIVMDATEELHKSFRGARGRTLSRKVMVLRTASIARLIKKKQALVGYEKAGWAQAASALGVKLTGWISRHGTRGGLFRDDTASELPSITMGNLIGYAQEHGSRLQVIQRALARRVESLQRRIEHIVAKNFKAAA